MSSSCCFYSFIHFLQINFVLFIGIIIILVQKLQSPDIGGNESSIYLWVRLPGPAGAVAGQILIQFLMFPGGWPGPRCCSSLSSGSTTPSSPSPPRTWARGSVWCLNWASDPSRWAEQPEHLNTAESQTDFCWCLCVSSSHVFRALWSPSFTVSWMER